MAGLAKGDLALGAAFYDFRLDERVYRGVALSSRRFARELDVYALWRPRLHPKLYLELSPLYAVAWPGAAAREFFARGDAYHVFQLYAFLQF